MASLAVGRNLFPYIFQGGLQPGSPSRRPAPGSKQVKILAVQYVHLTNDAILSVAYYIVRQMHRRRCATILVSSFKTHGNSSFLKFATVERKESKQKITRHCRTKLPQLQLPNAK